MMFVYASIISINTMTSCSIHFPENGKSLFFVSIWYSYMYAHHIFLNHLHNDFIKWLL
jgi:ribonuclease BN (tRNA processing enzyme)